MGLLGMSPMSIGSKFTGFLGPSLATISHGLKPSQTDSYPQSGVARVHMRHKKQEHLP